MHPPRRNIAPPVTPANRSPANASLPVWVRIGLPAVLALLAGILNTNTIRQQLNPIQAYALTVGVAPGIQLRADHLELVSVGGNLDRSSLITQTDLLATLEIESESTETVKAALIKTPLIFSKPIGKGELLTVSCLGGTENVRVGEERIFVPFTNIEGDRSALLPGQWVYFRTPVSNSEKHYAKIGPFRIPFAAFQEFDDIDDAYLPLDFSVGPNGDYSESTELLIAAADSRQRAKLSIVEEASQTLTGETQEN